MSDHGASHFRNVSSYHLGLVSARTPKRVIIAAPKGIPKNTATLVATVEYEVSTVEEPPITLRNKMLSGA